MKAPKKHPGKGQGKPAARLRDDCIEFVPVKFEFRDQDRTKTWDRAIDIQCFSCPVCGGDGNVPCDSCTGTGKRKGKWCLACEGMGATGCESCESGVVPNWPTHNVIYPLPESFDHSDALSKTKFNYAIIVKIGTRFFLAYAIPERRMRDVAELPVAMVQAYIKLGHLPPAQLVCRLLDDHNLDFPGRAVLVHCRRSLSICSKQWAGRFAKFNRRFPGR